jgi:hypothetical protein
MSKYLLLSLTLFVTACTTSQPIPTPTSIPTILSSQPIEVTFDGNECTVTSPSELPAGEYTTIFTDLSDLKAEVWLVYLKDGYTIQDHLDGQSEPGVWYPKPSWMFYDKRYAIDSEESNGRRVTTTTWILDRIGEHNIVCYVSSPQMLWIEASLMIVEPPSK